jgi:hypothetical protein
MTPTLYHPKRTCCVCKSEATGNTRTPIAGEPNIISISFVIYRRGTGKGELRGAQRVQVCEDCLTKSLHFAKKGIDSKLWEAIKESLQNRYSGMCEGDKR